MFPISSMLFQKGGGMRGLDGRALERKVNPFPTPTTIIYGGVCIPPSPRSLSLSKIVSLHQFKFPPIHPCHTGAILSWETKRALFYHAKPRNGNHGDEA